MKRSMKIGFCAMRLCVMVLGIFLILPNVSAKDETLDVQAFLPLLERNSIDGKVLDVTYTLNYEENFDGRTSSSKQDIRLVFDALTRRYREEKKIYLTPADAKELGYDYEFVIDMWDGKEYASWSRIAKTPRYRALWSKIIAKTLRNRALRQDIYEGPGGVMITSRNPLGKKPPFFANVYFDESSRSFTETVPTQNPKLTLTENMVAIETEEHKFEFSKQTGALERLTAYGHDENEKRIVIETYDLSNHVEKNGVWMPLKVVYKLWLNDQVIVTAERSVDSKTLRLFDKVEDDSIFNETYPPGCFVKDDIRNTSYRVTPAW